MKRIGFIYGLLFCLVLSVAAQEKVVKLKIVETSDVHGNYYPYNFFSFHFISITKYCYLPVSSASECREPYILQLTGASLPELQVP